MSSNLVTRTTRFLFWVVALLLGSSSNNLRFANALGTKNSVLPLFESSNVHCDEMVILHRWEGSCCSLMVTEANGCILNVLDGWCKVYGSVWTLNYNSTYDLQSCPVSEYTPEMMAMKAVDDPNSGGMSSFGATSQTAVTMTGIFGTAIALVVLG